MEEKVEVLEAMFQKTDAQLDQLSVELEASFKHEMQEKGKGKTPNPATMMKKIKEIKEEYSEIVKEAQAIAVAQQEAMAFFQQELAQVCEVFMKLQTNTGQQAPNTDELEKKVEKLLGLPVPSPAVQHDAKQSCEDEPEASEQAQGAASEDVPAIEESPFTKRANSTKYIEITQQEFDSVSPSIRGRVKLSEVNHTYRILWSHFKGNNRTVALSSRDMYQMGLRVTGQTGLAKLKVLKALKLLEIDKKGWVSLL